MAQEMGDLVRKVGTNIRAHRRSKGLSCRGLAAKASIGLQTLVNLEWHISQDIDMISLNEICAAMGVAVTEICG